MLFRGISRAFREGSWAKRCAPHRKDVGGDVGKEMKSSGVIARGSRIMWRGTRVEAPVKEKGVEAVARNDCKNQQRDAEAAHDIDRATDDIRPATTRHM